MTEPNRLTHPGVPDHQPAAGGIAARGPAAPGKPRGRPCRIAHILSQGRARPGEILSVTFTNKAAREMKLRLGQMLGQAVEGMPWLGTFHSIGGGAFWGFAATVR